MTARDSNGGRDLLPHTTVPEDDPPLWLRLLRDVYPTDYRRGWVLGLVLGFYLGSVVMALGFALISWLRS